MCNHDKYRGRNYMMAANALRAMANNKIVWRGKVVTHCECGVDISHARRVRVMTADEYLKDMGVDHGKKRRGKRG